MHPAVRAAAIGYGLGLDCAPAAPQGKNKRNLTQMKEGIRADARRSVRVVPRPWGWTRLFIGTRSLRRTKVAPIYRQTGNLRAVQLLLGHRNLSTTAQYLMIATSKVCATASPLESLHVVVPTAPDLVPA